MGIMTYWPIMAMGVSLSFAGGGGYIDLKLADNSMSKDITSAENRLINLETSMGSKINISQFAITVAELEDQGGSIDSNEEAIEEIQRILIQRQGRMDLDVQRLQSDIEKQNLKLDQLIEILEDIKRQ